MVRSFLYRIENLLLIVPVILFLLYQFFIGNSALDIHLHDTYFVMDTTIVLIISFVFMLVPYLFHFGLRLLGKWDKQICRTHVYATIFLFVLILLFCLLFINENSKLTPRKYYDISTWELGSPSSFLNNASGIFIILFILLQLTFFIYSLIIGLKKAK